MRRGIKKFVAWGTALVPFQLDSPNGGPQPWAGRLPRLGLQALTQIVGTVLAALLAPAVAHAQGCAMCYTGAAAQSEQGIRALNLGILVLLLPAAAIFAGIFWMAYRSRDAWSAQTPAAGKAGPGSGLLPLDFSTRQEGSW